MPVIHGQNHLRRVRIEGQDPVEAGASSSSQPAQQVHEVEAPSAHHESAAVGAGARAALHGLATVTQRPPRVRGWKKAVMTALIGISVLGPALGASAQRPMVRSLGDRPDRVEIHATGPPPPAPEVPSFLMARPHAKPPEHPAPTTTAPTTTAPTVTVVDPIPAGPHQGLPDTLFTLSDGAAVTHGSDPGDFYCEHAFYTTTTVARAGGTSILTDKQGEVLTAFLHNPSDDFTYDASKTPVQAERHKDRREIIGAAIRGYYETAKPQIGDGPFRMLITGYGEWGGVVNNPTGDFVAHRENIDAAVQKAFGDSLVDPFGKVLIDKDGVIELRYRIRDEASGNQRIVRITAAQLAVADEAIDGGPKSLQHLIDKQRPHAVLSMGVAGGSSTFLAEFHADNGGLGVKNGKPAHDDSKQPDTNTPDNYSLARALEAAERARNPHDGLRPVTSIAGGAGGGG